MAVLSWRHAPQAIACRNARIRDSASGVIGGRRFQWNLNLSIFATRSTVADCRSFYRTEKFMQRMCVSTRRQPCLLLCCLQYFDLTAAPLNLTGSAQISSSQNSELSTARKQQYVIPYIATCIEHSTVCFIVSSPSAFVCRNRAKQRRRSQTKK